MRLGLFVLLFTLSLFSDTNGTIYEDKYTFSSVDGNCTLEKNGKTIPSFDLKLGKKAPRSDYSCSAMQKEQYRECTVLERKNISALLTAYGSYEKTNLVIAFKNPHKSVKSLVVVGCTKKENKK